jgi:hypothetical protein
MDSKTPSSKKPYSGRFSDWVLLTWHDDGRIKHNNEIGSADSITVCIGVLQSDTLKRFSEYRPIRTSPVIHFDQVNMTIETENSRYSLQGEGSLRQVTNRRLEEVFSTLTSKISAIAREYREDRTTH